MGIATTFSSPGTQSSITYSDIYFSHFNPQAHVKYFDRSETMIKSSLTPPKMMMLILLQRGQLSLLV